MIRDISVAQYFLSLDEDRQLFNKKLCNMNGRTFYEGNARLNKYMHLAQNIYIAKCGKPLIDSVFYAYDNGAVDPLIQENYAVLLERQGQIPSLPENEKNFLKAIYKAFSGASLKELIELSQEDSEWIDKHNYYQKMDSMNYKDEYAGQYADMVKVLERMGV